MKALLLVGGRGTRLKPLTDLVPKPMVSIMGKPLLERTILKLKENGVDEVVLSTCYQSHQIHNHFADGRKFGVRINYIHEEKPLGTGGAIKNAERFFDDTFLVLNSDIISDINIQEMVDFHKKKSAAVTLAVTRVDNPSQYGVIEFDNNSRIKSFKEKPRLHEITSNYINAGVYVFEPEVFKEIPQDRVVSVEKEVYPDLLSKGYPIFAYKDHSYWIDIGTPEKYIRVHKDIMNGSCSLISPDEGWNHIGNLVLKGKNTRIHPKTKIIGPVYVGQNVHIDAEAFVGPDVVIGDNTYIAGGSRVLGSVIWDNVELGEGAVVMNAVVASNCRVSSNSSVINGVWVDGFDDSIAV